MRVDTELELCKMKKNALGNLVSYQEDSVVSKEILKKAKGTITLFAFDKGQGLSAHTAPFDAFVYILDGQAEVTIAGSAYRVTCGEMIIMPANKEHSLKALKRFKMLLVLLR